MALLAGKTVKTRRRKAAKAKPCGAQGPEHCDHSSVADLQEQLDRRTRERDEAREQQAATADVLKVISRSTFDLPTVLNTLAESASRLCEADHVWVYRRDGEVYRWAASCGYSKQEHEWIKQSMPALPLAPGRGSCVGRTALEGRPVQIGDVLADPEYEFPDVAKLGRFRTMLGVPLIREGVPIGVIVLQRAEVRPCSIDMKRADFALLRHTMCRQHLPRHAGEDRSLPRRIAPSAGLLQEGSRFS